MVKPIFALSSVRHGAKPRLENGCTQTTLVAQNAHKAWFSELGETLSYISGAVFTKEK